MPSVFKRGDNKWCLKWKGDSGKWRYVYRSSESAVREGFEDLTSKPSTDNRTVGVLLGQYLEESDVSPRTYENKEILIRTHLKPAIGSRKIDTLSPQDIRGLLEHKLNSGLAPSSVKRICSLLKSALPPQCMEGVKPPRAPRSEMDVLTKSELLRLLESVEGMDTRVFFS